MEGNKDEALKCLKIGKEAIEAGDRTRAIKFLSKARRLDPSIPVDDLLSLAADAGDQGKTTAPDGAPAAAGSGAASDEPMGPRTSSTSTIRNRAKASDSSKAYTEEQITIVQQINKQKDYYQIMRLERSCTVDDVRKAYRKLSLKVHPDKNHAPGAEEAFKAVSKAFQCLSNEETRKRYDLCGSDEPSQSRAAARQHNAHGFNGFYEAEFDPDEIFRSFFSGMAPTATAFGPFQFRTGGMHTQNAHGTNAHGNFNLRTLIQLLPILIFFFSQFFPSSSPEYMLSRQYPYEHKVETSRGVPYFVKSAKFEEEYPSDSAERIGLEKHVERDFFGTLSQNCRTELQRRRWGYTDKTPHCDMLRKYEGTFA